MPLYEYQCEACGQRFEVIQKFSDPPAAVCTKCGKGPVQRLMSSPAIQFKGSGWYITDYAKKSSTDASTPKTDKTDSGSKSEAKSGDSSKSESPSTGAKETSTPSKDS